MAGRSIIGRALNTTRPSLGAAPAVAVNPATQEQTFEQRAEPRHYSEPVRMTASEALVETMARQGVEKCYGIVGSAFMDALDIFPEAGIRFVAVQHEQNAAHMADGYSRISGKHGVCTAQNGPGISNFVTGIAAAYWAHSPVIALTPEASTMTKGHGGFQEVDQLPLFEPITKYQGHVNNPARMAEITNRAFDIAMAERGPTQINFPRDYLYYEGDYQIPKPTIPEKGAGGPKSILAAVELIRSAKNPVILAGGGVTMAGAEAYFAQLASLVTPTGGGVTMAGAEAQVAQLASLLSAPVAVTYLHNDAFPADHPLYAGSLGYQGSQTAMHSIREADVVIALGTRLSPFGTLPQYGEEYWPKNAKIIQFEQRAEPRHYSEPVRMTASEALVETMARQGVEKCYGIVGSAFMDALDIFPEAGIRFVAVQHEQNAAHMADGYSRISGKHGVCTAQNGPGISNFVTGIAAAYWAHSPVIALTPEASCYWFPVPPKVLQLVEGLFEPITKYQGHVNNPARMAEITNRAFDIAMAERGPTQINFPRDYLYYEGDYQIPKPTIPEKGAGGPKSILAAVELIRSAKNPVILAGGGVTMAGAEAYFAQLASLVTPTGGGVTMAGAEAQVAQLASLLSAPVAVTYLHNDAFPADHPLYAGSLGYQGSQTAMHSIREADVVIALGTRLSPFGTLPQYGEEYWPKNAKIIQVEVDPRRIGLTKNVDVGICGDVKLATEELTSQLKDGGFACMETVGERLETLSKVLEECERSETLARQLLGYQGSQTAMHSIREADVVIALGTRLSPFGTLPQYGEEYWPKNAKIIQVEVDPRRIGLTKNVDVGICGDVKLATEELTSQLKDGGFACMETVGERLETLAKRRITWTSNLDAMTNEYVSSSTPDRVRPRQALRELELAMERDSIVSTDIGNICSVANSYLKFSHVGPSMLAAMTFGNCGYSLPAVMGAKTAAPHRNCVSYSGDGAWGMQLNEIMTCIREEIPVTAVVFNNGQWGAEKKNQVLWFGDRYIGSQLKNPWSYAEIARSMAAEGITCTHLDQVGDALRTASQNQRDGKTTVIEIMVTKELGDPFRRDAMKLPFRHLEKFHSTIQTTESSSGQPTDL
eukprot:sb/3461368/